MPTYGLYLADLNRMRNDSQGIINYALGLVGGLPALLAEEERLIVIANPEILDELEGSDGFEVEVVPSPSSIPSRLWSDHIGSVIRARRATLDLIHFPKGHIPALRPRRPKVVATVHDDINLRYLRKAMGGRDEARPLKDRYFTWSIRHSLRRADRVITISEFSARRLSELSPRHAPITVTYEGVTLPDVPTRSSTEKIPHVLHLGSAFPHKNTSKAASWTLRYLRERRSDLSLRVLGRFDPSLLPDDPRIERKGGILSNRAMAEELAASRALVFMSTYEGFGLPPIEAYWLGTPAVFPAVTAMTEVLEGVPGDFDPDDYRSFADSLDHVLSLSDDDVAEVTRMLRRRYSWEEAARRTLDVYRSLIE